MNDVSLSAAEILGKEKIPTLQTIFQKIVGDDFNLNMDSLVAVQSRLETKYAEIEKAGGIDKYINLKKE